MAVIVAGLNHCTAPIQVRERLCWSASRIGDGAMQLREVSAAREAVLLSTCNRTEVYLVEEDARAISAVWATLSVRLGEAAEPYGYVHRDREAVAHLYRVAAGLDSMIVGEAQIHGQVREAWERSRPASGPVLNRLFQTALSVAGRVRSETAVGRGAASVSSAAVQLAKKIFGTLQGRRAMVLGAGEMAELALECLTGEGVRAAVVANRTYERAGELASRYGARALHYDECWSRLHEVDVLICSTSAPHAIVHTPDVERAILARGDHPMCILDIALPRDVEPEVGTLRNVFLYDLDDLGMVVSANLERRREELPTAEQLIAAETDIYWQWLAALAAVPVLTSFRGRAEELRARELEQALRRLDHLPPEDRAAIEHFSRALMNKFLHEPSVRLRAAAANGQGLAVVDALRYLFALREYPGSASGGDEGAEDSPR